MAPTHGYYPLLTEQIKAKATYMAARASPDGIDSEITTGIDGGNVNGLDGDTVNGSDSDTKNSNSSEITIINTNSSINGDNSGVSSDTMPIELSTFYGARERARIKNNGRQSV
jgi:hypothetical protein